MTILGVMVLMYAVLMVMCCMKADKVIMKYENLIWTKDNDGRKMAVMRLNDVYSVRVMEFSEDGIPYYIVSIRKDGEHLNSIDYCTSDDVSAIMERLQTVKD